VAALLNVGDVVRVHAGESFPADGEVLAGHSSVNESLLTGESRPLPRAPGGVVIAGSINLDSPLTVRVSQVGPNTRLAGVVRLLDQALAEKPRLAKLADRFAGWFVAVLLLAAAASYLGWLAIAPDRALWIMVAVLVVSCPCALSLATPAALTAATGHLAGIGMLTTRGHALETLAKVSDAVFDKTGTLTHGDMRLLQTLPLGALPEAEALALARGMEAHAHHPIARAFAAAEHANTPAPALDEVSYQAGCGLQAQVAGHTWPKGVPIHENTLPAAAGGSTLAAALNFLQQGGIHIAGRSHPENYCPVHENGQAHRPSPASCPEKIFAAPGQGAKAASRQAKPETAESPRRGSDQH
jgi:Cu2+-exporting ATPase